MVRIGSALRVPTTAHANVIRIKIPGTLQPICISDLIFVPVISIRNLSKIASVYTNSPTISARLYSVKKLWIGEEKSTVAVDIRFV